MLRPVKSVFRFKRKKIRAFRCNLMMNKKNKYKIKIMSLLAKLINLNRQLTNNSNS